MIDPSKATKGRRMSKKTRKKSPKAASRKTARAAPAKSAKAPRLQTGRFEPRDVKLGHRGGGYVEVRDGLNEGEQVVTSANFLIDAESNLKSALKGFSEAGAQP
jgi:multidrug efflux pump subunit AcrA (membrane-fusion protein)